MRDIAKAADVSVMTVSQVLNPRNSPVRVSSETREKILRLVDELHYQPNLAAKVLAGESSHLIGILIDSQAPAVSFRTLSCIEREAAKFGYGLMIAEAHDNVTRLSDSYHRLLRHGVDGIISLAHDYPGEEDKLRQCFSDVRKVVFIDKPCVETSLYVKLDWESGVEAAVNHLKKRGCGRIGILRSCGNWRSLQERQNGYEKTVTEAFIHFQPLTYDKAELVRQAVESVDFIMANQLDAILAQNDFYAAAIINELERRGLKVPQDIAVVGYDNEFFSDFFNPGISSIDWDIDRQAVAAVEMLLKTIENPGMAISPVIVKNQFIIRESVQK